MLHVRGQVIAVMKSSVPILICAAMHLSLVLYGLSQPGSAEEFTFLATQGLHHDHSFMERGALSHDFRASVALRRLNERGQGLSN